MPLTLQELLGGGPLPAWIQHRQGRRDPVQLDSWSGGMVMYNPKMLTETSRFWCNDFKATRDDSMVFTTGFHSAARAAWLREGGPRPIGGVDGVACESFEGVGYFTPCTAGPVIRGQQMVHGGAIATLFDSFLGQTNVLNGSSVLLDHEKAL